MISDQLSLFWMISKQFVGFLTNPFDFTYQINKILFSANMKDMVIDADS